MATAENQDAETQYPQRSPWWYVCTLYFMQGLPVMMIQNMSVTLYKKMGVGNVEIGVWTSLIAWPWIVKMLWGPVVDTTATKRSWIISMQLLIVVGLGLAAASLQLPNFLAVSLAIFFGVAFLSATHDIAADGFYMLTMNQERQAFFVGIRSACFRCATIFTTGVLVVYAGTLEKEGMPIPETWTRAIGLGCIVYAVFLVWNYFALPNPRLDFTGVGAQIGKLFGQFAQILFMLLGLALCSRLVYMGYGVLSSLKNNSWGEFTKNFGTPLYLETLNRPEFFFLELPASLALIAAAYVSTKKLFGRIGMGEAAREFFGQEKIAAVLCFILFYRFGESMIGKLSAPFLLDSTANGGLGVTTDVSGYIVGTVGVIALTVGGLLGGFLISKYGIKKCFWPMVLSLNVPNLLYVWASFAKPASTLSAVVEQTKDLGFWESIGPRMSATLSDPIAGIVGVDQFGYGFGFAAYMVYLLFLCQGHRLQTSMYAIATGLMALGAMFAGISSGFVQNYFKTSFDPAMSYAYFFIAVCVCTIPGMLTLFFIPMNKQDLKVAPVDID